MSIILLIYFWFKRVFNDLPYTYAVLYDGKPYFLRSQIITPEEFQQWANTGFDPRIDLTFDEDSVEFNCTGEFKRYYPSYETDLSQAFKPHMPEEYFY